LNFFGLSEFGIKDLPPFVLVFSEVSILDDHILALLGAPDLVFEFFFLSGLPLHELDDHMLPLFLLKLYHKLLLLPNQPPSAFFPHQSTRICHGFLSALLQAG
jgi:hypothetical protein